MLGKSEYKAESIILLIIAVVLFFICGCKTKCPPASVVIHDSIHESIVYIPHDTTIYTTLPPVTVVQQLECDSLGIIKAFKRTFRQGSTIITEEVKGGVLTVTCAEDSLKQVITLMNKEKSDYVEHYKTTTLKPEIQYREHAYLKYLWIYLIVTLLGFILWVWVKIKPV